MITHSNKLKLDLRRVSIALLSLAVFGWVFGVATVRTTTAAENFTTDSYIAVATGDFLIQNFSDYLDSDTDSIRSNFAGWINGNDIFLPTASSVTLDPTITINQITVDQTNSADWQAIRTLYTDIRDANPADIDNQTPGDDWHLADTAVKNIDSALTAFGNAPLSTTTPPAAQTNSVPNSISIKPASITLTPVQATTITGIFGNHVAEPNKYCYFYIGDGKGTFLPAGNATQPDTTTGKCSYAWTPDPTAVVGLHTVYITFQQNGYPHDSTFTVDTPPFDLSGAVHDVVNVCGSGSCTDFSNTGAGGGFRVDRNAVIIGTSPSPKFSLWISDGVKANDYNTAGKECYFYIGDGNGGWTLMGADPVKKNADANGAKPPAPNCAFTWDFSGTAPGDHGFMVNILDGNLTPAGDPSLSPNGLTVTVCAAGATTCQGTGKNSDNGAMGTQAKTGTFNANVDTSDSAFEKFLNAAGKVVKLNPNLRTPAGIFEFILKLAADFIGVLAFIAIIVGGFMVMTGSGDITGAGGAKTSGGVTKGKKSIVYGVIGLVIAVLAYGIVGLVVNTLNTPATTTTTGTTQAK